jgi:multiple sugar transport system substrate-binding protein
MANYIYMLNPKMSEVLVPWVLEPYLPRILRPFNYEWGVAPFPSAGPGLDNVTWVGFDALVIPRGARHPHEAFEFIAFVNRQDEMEKLCSLHCKNSPLRQVSDDFIRSHPNPYIDVFQQLARSPNARWLPEIEIWPEVDAELTNMAQEVYLQTGPPEKQPKTIDILRATQDRLQAEYDRYRQSQEMSHR